MQFICLQFLCKELNWTLSFLLLLQLTLCMFSTSSGKNWKWNKVSPGRRTAPANVNHDDDDDGMVDFVEEEIMTEDGKPRRWVVVVDVVGL